MYKIYADILSSLYVYAACEVRLLSNRAAECGPGMTADGLRGRCAPGRLNASAAAEAAKSSGRYIINAAKPAGTL